jgi:hypothetical protein
MSHSSLPIARLTSGIRSSLHKTGPQSNTGIMEIIIFIAPIKIDMINQFLAGCFLMLLLTGSVSAQATGEKRAVLTVKHTSDFEITGDGHATAWTTTEWIPLVHRKGTTTYATRVKLLYSDTGIYSLFSCEDLTITATLQEDFTALFKEDVVEVFFWPDETMPVYFEYELSPLNYELALLIPNIDGDVSGWKPWPYKGARATRHATKVLKDDKTKSSSWTAEFFIPYTLLRPLRNVPPAKGTQWRANLYRIDYDQGFSTWTWQPVRTEFREFHDFEQFGTLRFE